jgi:hypothetical protein
MGVCVADATLTAAYHRSRPATPRFLISPLHHSHISQVLDSHFPGIIRGQPESVPVQIVTIHPMSNAVGEAKRAR